MDDQQQPQSPSDIPSDASNEERVSGERLAATPDMEAEMTEAGAVPPGYDWPTHGGYLGCLLGLLPACLVAAFLGSTFVAVLNKAGIVPPVVAGLLVVALFVACVIGFGRIGWVLGRRFYRKYPRAEPTWGEDDGEPHTAAAANMADTSQEETASDQATHQTTP